MSEDTTTICEHCAKEFNFNEQGTVCAECGCWICEECCFDEICPITEKEINP